MAYDINRWDPMNEINQMRQLFNRIYRPNFREDVELGGFESSLPVDVFEQDNHLVVKAALPGMSPEDIKVDISEGILHITAETREEDNVDRENYHRREYMYGRMSRSLRLPPGIDAMKAEATYKNGMLRLKFPRTEGTKARSIKVSSK